jgi:peptide/nickel transport system substrate-binding protein
MRAATWLQACVVLCVLAGACTPDADDAVAERPQPRAGPTQAGSEPATTVEGGTVVVAVAEEPATLNPWLASHDSNVAAIAHPMLAPLWRVRPDGTFEPWLLADEPTVRAGGQGEPFSVTYRIREEAVWSDGQPIDGGDVLFTLQTCLEVAPRDDCAAVDIGRSQADGKQVTVAFERPIPHWRTILSTLPVLPRHELRDRDLATTWTHQVSVSSGPFRFGSSTPGEQLVLVRNERWWGEPARLDSVAFRFGDSPDVATIAEGAADVARLPATPDVVDGVRADPRVRTAVETGRHWLALDFNLATPVLQAPQVRRALAQALDRATIVTELIHPVSSEPAVLDALPGGPTPADAQAPAFPTHDVAAAARGLDGAGCPVNQDGRRVCGREPLELILVTTDPDWQQSILAEYVQSQLEDLGVRVIIESEPSADVPSASPSESPVGSGSWDLRIATVATAEDPTYGGRRWRCDDPANTQSFCVSQYDTLVQRAAETLDGDVRADLHAQAALLLARELPTYPLYEIPAVLVHAATVRGPTPNAGPWGMTWNIEEWARTADQRLAPATP